MNWIGLDWIGLVSAEKQKKDMVDEFHVYFCGGRGLRNEEGSKEGRKEGRKEQMNKKRSTSVLTNGLSNYPNPPLASCPRCRRPPPCPEAASALPHRRPAPRGTQAHSRAAPRPSWGPPWVRRRLGGETPTGRSAPRRAAPARRRAGTSPARGGLFKS